MLSKGLATFSPEDESRELIHSPKRVSFGIPEDGQIQKHTKTKYNFERSVVSNVISLTVLKHTWRVAARGNVRCVASQSRYHVAARGRKNTAVRELGACRAKSERFFVPR
jgi:hypothetical protein